MDDPYNKIQLQTELGIDFFFIKSISSCSKVDVSNSVTQLLPKGKGPVLAILPSLFAGFYTGFIARV